MEAKKYLKRSSFNGILNNFHRLEYRALDPGLVEEKNDPQHCLNILNMMGGCGAG